MRTHSFKVLLKNGELFTRGEWGRTARSAARAIFSCYGENIARVWHYEDGKFVALA